MTREGNLESSQNDGLRVRLLKNPQVGDFPLTQEPSGLSFSSGEIYIQRPDELNTYLLSQ
jgi:hypothetical protein